MGPDSSHYKTDYDGWIPQRKAASSLHKQGSLVVSSAALSGAPVWVEKKYYETLFFSNAVKKEIDAAGLGSVFALRPVDVVSE